MDVHTALDAGMIERRDEKQLEYAAAEGRVLYSFNVRETEKGRVGETGKWGIGETEKGETMEENEENPVSTHLSTITPKLRISTYRDLDVYKMAMEGAVRIFELTKTFPSEEKFSLVDQIRRSSRSVCANISEAWRKRRYEAAFVSKLSDAETEAAETQVWAEMAFRCGYWKEETFLEIDRHYDQIMGKLIRMMDNPQPWLIVAKEAGKR